MNHLYWSAVSTPDGNKDLIEAKWLSVDKHKKHGKLFPACKHRRIYKRGRKKKFLHSSEVPIVLY